MLNKQGYRKPQLGQILLDGGFLSRQDLEVALVEQKKTNELLGQVLVRMGVIDPLDITAALSVQSYLHIGRLEDAVRIAAGVRRKLGELLFHSGRITERQLEQALAEQQRSGEKLGKVLMRLGLLTEEQLNGLLYFQRIQEEAIPSPGPLRLGELLVTTGRLTRDQLDKALGKQAASRKQLGDVLIEEGYVEPRHVKQGMRLQEMLLAAVLAALLTACGAAGPADYAAPSDATKSGQEEVGVTSNYFAISSSDYPILQPNYYYSTNNGKFWSIQAAVARDVWDDEYKCIVRIDIQKSADGAMPAINKTFSIEENANHEQFPGTFLLFNGEKSAHKNVESGTITFSSDSDASGQVSASFEVLVTDYDSTTVPVPQYHLTGSFRFKMGSYGPANTL